MLTNLVKPKAVATNLGKSGGRLYHRVVAWFPDVLQLLFGEKSQECKELWLVKKNKHRFDV
jgi:hypothetical protein